MDYASELTRVLMALGDTADAVAGNLGAARIKGVRNTVRFLNPVVRYCQFQLHLDEYALDLIQPNTLRMILPDGVRRVEVAVPPPVKEFLLAYHRGKFSDLELPNP
jgi:hypothetical protein